MNNDLFLSCIVANGFTMMRAHEGEISNNHFRTHDDFQFINL